MPLFTHHSSLPPICPHQMALRQHMTFHRVIDLGARPSRRFIYSQVQCVEAEKIMVRRTPWWAGAAVSYAAESVLTLPGSAGQGRGRRHRFSKLILARRYCVNHPVHECPRWSVRIVAYERQALGICRYTCPLQVGRDVAAVAGVFNWNRSVFRERAAGYLDVQCRFLRLRCLARGWSLRSG